MALLHKQFTNKLRNIRFKSTVQPVKLDVPPPTASEVQEPLRVRWMKYWNSLYNDYYEVGKDLLKEIRQKPLKTVIYLSGLSTAAYSAKTNPDQKSFVDYFTTYKNDLLLVPMRLQNSKTRQHLTFIEDCSNAGLTRRLNLGILSLIWMDDYDAACKLYPCTCTYLRPELLTFNERVIDIGFWNRWWVLNKMVVDYDVNID